MDVSSLLVSVYGTGVCFLCSTLVAFLLIMVRMVVLNGMRLFQIATMVFDCFTNCYIMLSEYLKFPSGGVRIYSIST